MNREIIIEAMQKHYTVEINEINTDLLCDMFLNEDDLTVQDVLDQIDHIIDKLGGFDNYISHLDTPIQKNII